jgi:hypothetical protein
MAEGVAQFIGTATAPAHRRRGVQTALLSARLADAAAAGCDFAVITTQPGSKSQQNAQRRGFDLLYTRAVLCRGIMRDPDPARPMPLKADLRTAAQAASTIAGPGTFRLTLLFRTDGGNSAEMLASGKTSPVERSWR